MNPKLILLLAIAITVVCIVQLRKLAKYEFDNRTDGGVIEFKDFGGSSRHNAAKVLFRFLLFLSVMGGSVAGIFAASED